jgi:hypothetical protein
LAPAAFFWIECSSGIELLGELASSTLKTKEEWMRRSGESFEPRRESFFKEKRLLKSRKNAEIFYFSTRSVVTQAREVKVIRVKSKFSTLKRSIPVKLPAEFLLQNPEVAGYMQ